MSEYFDKELIDDIVLIVVNSTSATTQHADEISKIIKAEIVEERKKIVVDLSQCKFVDSIFLGAKLSSPKNSLQNYSQYQSHYTC
jgi:anti-anti-sigma regulatory factor